MLQVETGSIKTYTTTEPPDGTYVRIASRSGLAFKSNMHTIGGVIDPDYTGELKVILFNHGGEKFEIKQGDRIAQLILEKCETPPIEEVASIEDTERGTRGFGSSG